MIASKILVMLFGLNLMGPPVDRPPELTFDKHVDYIGWWSDFVSRGKSRNAFELYRPLLPDASGDGGMPLLSGEAKADYDRMKAGVWSPSDYPALAAHLRECAPYFDALKAAVRIDDYWEPVPPGIQQLIGIMMPSLAVARDAYRLTLLESFREQERQPEAFLDAIRMALRISGHMRQQPIIICGLVSLGGRSLVYAHVLAALEKGLLTDSDVRKAYDALREFDPGAFDWQRAVVSEWAIALDTLQSISPDGKVDLAQWKKIDDGEAFDPYAARDLVEEHFKSVLAIIDGSLNAKTAMRLHEISDAAKDRIRGNPFTKTFLANLGRAYNLCVRIESHRRGTMIALALYAHHIKHGEWPKRLKDLDKDLGLRDYRDYGKDPFSGKLFKYKLVDGKPLLYSIGSDGKDDGGRHDKKWGEKNGGDFVFVPYQE